MDINREIRVAVNTGNVSFGVKEAKDNVEEGNAELLIGADNCPEEEVTGNDYKDVPIYHFTGKNKELGSAAGKPFAISTLAVMDSGDSNILSLKAD
ncbi:MAG: 50S ribosomal protein L30e [Thermoplasmatota archaeon]